MEIKVIITGATGMVGEGVMFECLDNANVKQVLILNRRPYGMRHPKLKELIVEDFFNLAQVENQLIGYDACFYCAGISSAGMKEADYTRITYDTTLHVANTLARLNSSMVFSHISGNHTDGTEKSGIMWARVKGRTENALMRLPFKNVYNFRPGLMKPTDGQKNIKGPYKIIRSLYPVVKFIFPKHVLLLKEVGQAMINSVVKGYGKQVLEIKDIKELATGT